MSLVIGIAFFSVLRPGITTRWKQEQAPPEQATLLKLGINGEILAQTPGGNLYEMTSGWKSVTGPTENTEMGGLCYSGDANHYLILPPPGKVISRVTNYCVATESGYHTEVVLLENGEVWSWRIERGGYTGLLLVVMLGIALVLGAPLLLIGLGMKIYQKVIKMPS